MQSDPETSTLLDRAGGGQKAIRLTIRTGEPESAWAAIADDHIAAERVTSPNSVRVFVYTDSLQPGADKPAALFEWTASSDHTRRVY